MEINKIKKLVKNQLQQTTTTKYKTNTFFTKVTKYIYVCNFF